MCYPSNPAPPLADSSILDEIAVLVLFSAKMAKFFDSEGKKNEKVEKHGLKLKKEPWEQLHRKEILVQNLWVHSSSGSS